MYALSLAHIYSHSYSYYYCVYVNIKSLYKHRIWIESDTQGIQHMRAHTHTAETTSYTLYLETGRLLNIARIHNILVLVYKNIQWFCLLLHYTQPHQIFLFNIILVLLHVCVRVFCFLIKLLWFRFRPLFIFRCNRNHVLVCRWMSLSVYVVNKRTLQRAQFIFTSFMRGVIYIKHGTNTGTQIQKQLLSIFFFASGLHETWFLQNRFCTIFFSLALFHFFTIL